MKRHLSFAHGSIPCVTRCMLLRAGFVLAVFSCLLLPAAAAGPFALRGDVSVSLDVVTLGDLVDGLPAAEAARPVFRAPALGETGTIQVPRILEAAQAAGLSRIESAGRDQVTVTRAARRVPQDEIEKVVRRALEENLDLDLRSIAIVFEGAPSLILPPDLTAPLAVEELRHDHRTRRLSALVSAGGKPGDRPASLRVAGALVEIVEVAVLNRSLRRGETVEAGDISVERRPRGSVPADAQEDATQLIGREARRALSAGSLVRQGDLIRPELVARGDLVTIVYQGPGLMLTLRGRATQSGALGDTISVVNQQSKKVLQVSVSGPGTVSVAPAAPTALASAAGYP
ncbi:flagellar basal body P-ring formation chaperone FlgA [Microvirga massiliensis]|uniref:flagellar basal body P-ring formation chaperone FlgA n=1 Tax=Microvirga massiliensis TaxID=1033741 RepID=UPI00062B5EFF|nr:flagellar basal body P-ring formation chaperone FlgA [Microvirga massiliensis]